MSPEKREADKDDGMEQLHKNPEITDLLAVRVEYFPVSSCQEKIRHFFIHELNLEPLRIEFHEKSSQRGTFLFAMLSFKDLETAYNATCIIQPAQFLGENLNAFIQPLPQVVNKRLSIATDTQSSETEETDVDPLLEYKKKEDGLTDRTTPYSCIPYPKQLQIKQTTMHKILKKRSREMHRVGGKTLSDWLTIQQEHYNGLPCEVAPIRTTGRIKEYRNKCEFTIGKNYDGDDILIGFIATKLDETKKLDYVPVSPVDNLVHVPQKMKDVVKVLEEYIKSSGIEPYNPWNRSTCWSSATMRTNEKGDLMLMVTIEARDLPQSRLLSLKEDLQRWFEASGRAKGVTSLYFQSVYPKLKGVESKDEICHLGGAKYLEEKLCTMTFEISANAFFQVNTKAAELLYRTALELARVDKDTTVLDVCCGTGTIGIFFSQYCGEVLGVESVESAVINARENAKKNNIVNCEFFHGKAEDLLGPLIHRASKRKIVAIVDPPRAGLHKRALWSLRKESKIDRLIYISCDPNAAMKNVVDLARAPSKAYKGEPFVPREAVPVDMFPHTAHCELVLSLERLSSARKDTCPNTPQVSNVEQSLQLHDKKQDESIMDHNTVTADNSADEPFVKKAKISNQES